ncbi:tRNA dimethylallyltransferase, partial [Balneolaceae bacterium ANBcel3]|nr:tRNA dimethylallyltransferase [Balneolaceae bacterium ANBcel3]
KRTEAMIKHGLVDEIRSVLAKGYHPGLQSLQTVGYREGIAYLNGNLDKNQMTEDIKTHTRQYARRQITWFRRWSGAQTIQVDTHIEKKVINQIDILSEQLAAKS